MVITPQQAAQRGSHSLFGLARLKPGVIFQQAQEQMSAIEMLESQHREVEDLFEQFEEAKGAKKGNIFLQIADKLAVHATIEEKHFYPAAKT